jgi:hypothetical protein
MLFRIEVLLSPRDLAKTSPICGAGEFSCLIAQAVTRGSPRHRYSIFTNIMGQDGILPRIGNPLGLRNRIDRADSFGDKLTNLPHSNCENTLTS